MNLQHRFYTETKAHSHSNTLHTLKPESNFVNDQEFSRGELYPMLKYLTVKIHEANLIIDVSILGKMTTFAQVQLGSLTWKTSVDKESHMKPKWNESKTFEVKNLGKYFKNFHRNSASVSNNDLTSSPDKSQMVDPGIIIGVYDHAFFHDMLIGEIKISLKDILQTKPTGDYYIYNNNQMVGSIRITHKFEYGDEDLPTNFTQELGSSAFKFPSVESRFQSGSYNRVSTEPTETAKSTIYRTNLINHRNFPSNFSAQNIEFESAGPSLQKIGYQSADMGRNYHQQFGKVGQRLESASHDLTRANKKAFNNINAYKRKSEEKDYETLITYENYNEYGSDLDEEERQAYTDFFNCASSEGRTESSQEDSSDPGLDLGDYQNVRKGSIEDDLSYEGMEPAMILQKQLEMIKKLNYNLQNMRNAANLKAAESREVYEKYIKEKRILKAKQNDLFTREECLVNAKKNLESDIANLQQQEENLKEYRKGILEHKSILKQVLKEEDEQNVHKIQLENEIRQYSMSYQRETASLKKMERDMYKKLIAKRTEDMKRELEAPAMDENIEEVPLKNKKSSVRNVPEFGRDADDQREEYGQALDELLGQRTRLENDVEEQIQKIERLREILRLRNTEIDN